MRLENRNPGEIITFYSYKGGTGRTMALANVACMLAERLGKRGDGQAPPLPRVLIVDWDLEAPGLHRYFQPYATAREFDQKPGCLDFFSEINRRKYLKQFTKGDVVGNRGRAREIIAAIGFEKFLVKLRIDGLEGVSLLKAGRFDSGYAKRVADFDWVKFFSATEGFFLGLADFWQSEFDYVLIDSRTGVTDVSGICTALLPCKLVAVFTPNRQSLAGLAETVRTAVSYRRQSSDWRPLMVFPLLSRVETSRPALLERWRNGVEKSRKGFVGSSEVGYEPLFEQLFASIYGIEDCRLKDYFDLVQLRHVPDYAYGEPIAVIEESSESRDSLRGAYRDFVDRLMELPSPWVSLETARVDKRIKGLCDELDAATEARDVSQATRLGVLLGEQPVSPELLELVLDNLLRSARLLGPTSREAVQVNLNVAETLVGKVAEGSTHVVARAMSAIGDCYLDLGHYAQARRALDLALQACKDEEAQSPMSIRISNALGRALVRSGSYAKAVAVLTESLQIADELLGPENPPTLSLRDTLATALALQGDLVGARGLLEEALRVRRRVFGEEHPATLTSMGNLAATLGEQGDLAGARKLQETALEVCRRVRGEEHPETLTSMANLAGTLWAQGDLTAARALEEKVLEVRRRVLGEEHPDTLTSMNNLAGTLKTQGDLAGARDLHEKALEVSRRVLGEEHPDTLTSMNNLAETLRAQGDLAAARALDEKALEVRRRLLGEEHPNTLTAMNNLAGTLWAQGDLAGARALEEKVLDVRRRVLGEEHPNTLTSMNNLAATMSAQGDLVAARALEEKALEVRRRVQGEEHPDTLTAMNNLARTLRAQGRLVDARALQENTLEVRRRVLGEQHPDTVTSMNELAVTLSTQGELGGARGLQEKALEVLHRVFGEEHPNTLKSMNSLAATLRSLGELAGAKGLQEKVLEVRRRVLGEQHPDTLASVRAVASTLRSLGNLDAARRLLEQLLERHPQAPAARPPAVLGAMFDLLKVVETQKDEESAQRIRKAIEAGIASAERSGTFAESGSDSSIISRE